VTYSTNLRFSHKKLSCKGLKGQALIATMDFFASVRSGHIPTGSAAAKVIEKLAQHRLMAVSVGSLRHSYRSGIGAKAEVTRTSPEDRS
jgi:hypothetical protein